MREFFICIVAEMKKISNNDKNLNVEFVSKFVRERSKIFRIIPDSYEIEFNRDVQKLIDNFIKENEKQLFRKIGLAIKKEIKTLKYFNDSGNKIFKFIVRCYFFAILDIIKEVLTFEYYYMHAFIKTNVSRSYNEKIEGKYLGYNILTGKTYIKFDELSSLINHINILNVFSIEILRDKNANWYKEYKNLFGEKNIIKTVKNNKSQPGRKPKYKTQPEFHKKLKTISNLESLSKTELAKKLGYKSSSGLNELLKSKNWKLPE
jgi:hypothetical protein